MLYDGKMKAKGQHHCAAINLVLGSPIPAHTEVKVMVGSPGKRLEVVVPRVGSRALLPANQHLLLQRSRHLRVKGHHGPLEGNSLYHSHSQNLPYL